MFPYVDPAFISDIGHTAAGAERLDVFLHARSPLSQIRLADAALHRISAVGLVVAVCAGTLCAGRLADSALVLVSGHPFQHGFERRVVKAQTESVQCVLGGFAKLAGDRFGLAAIEGNLHLYPDSANLTAPVLQLDDQFRCTLT